MTIRRLQDYLGSLPYPEAKEIMIQTYLDCGGRKNLLGNEPVVSEFSNKIMLSTADDVLMILKFDLILPIIQLNDTEDMNFKVLPFDRLIAIVRKRKIAKI
jgi:hypothetical protein